MKYRVLALLLFVFALVNSNAAVILQMDMGFFGASPATNRTVTLNPQTPFPGNTLYAYSDTNGIAYLSNCPAGLINGVILAPPGRITFQVNILATDSGVINASNRLASGSSTTYPSGQVAWAIATSDTRYQLSGTTLSNTFYPLYSNPSNYLTLATDPKQTNGFTTIVFSNPAAFLPVSGTNGLIGFLQASNIAFYIYTNNPSNYVNQTQLTAATNGLARSSATNGLATTNFVLTSVATASNALSSASTTASNVLANGIIGATNGIKSAAYSNSTAFILTNALPNLTNNFYPLSNPSNYISGFTNTATATNISGDALLQVTNISFWVYTNNASNYVTATITNGFAGTNYVNSSTANASNVLVATGLNISNAITANLSASNVVIQANIAATNAQEIARVTAQIALTNTAIRSAMILTNTANLAITTNLFGVSTNYANTNAMRLIAASNAIVLITASNNLVNATNGFVINTNGTATSLTLASNAYFGSPVAQTLQLNGTPYFGLTGAGNTGVNGTYGKETSSIWTNFLNPNYTIILSGGIYYAQSNSVSLYAFATAPSTNGTIVSPGINPVPAFTLGWTFNLNGGVFIGQFNSTNETQNVKNLIAQYAVTNNSYQQITFYNTNNVYYGTFVGTNSVNATNATYLGGLFYTNYVTFGSIGGGYLTNNNNIVISGELSGSGTTNIILNPTATFTNDVNSLARFVSLTNLYSTNSGLANISKVATNSIVVTGSQSNIIANAVTNLQPVAKIGYIGWPSDDQPLLDYASVDFSNGQLQSYGHEIMAFEEKALYDGNNTATVAWGNNELYDTNTFLSVDWLHRKLYNAAGTVLLDWSGSSIAGNAHGLTNLFFLSVYTNLNYSTNISGVLWIGTNNFSGGSGSVTYPFAATTATNGATVSAGDATITVTPSVLANGVTNYALVANVGGGSSTNAIALLNGFGTNTTLIAGKSVTATNIVTTNIVPIGIQTISIVGANNGGTGVSPNFIMTPQASTSPGAHGSLYLQPGYSDGTGFVGGTNFVGRFVFSGISTFNHYAGQNTYTHQYAALPIMVLQPDYGASFQTNIFQILTNGVPVVYVDKLDILHAPMDATNLFNAGVLTNGFVTISAVTNGSVIPANVVTNAVYLTTSTANGTATITSNTLAITTFATVPSGLVTNGVAGIWTNISGINQTDATKTNVFAGTSIFSNANFTGVVTMTDVNVTGLTGDGSGLTNLFFISAYTNLNYSTNIAGVLWIGTNNFSGSGGSIPSGLVTNNGTANITNNQNYVSSGNVLVTNVFAQTVIGNGAAGVPSFKTPNSVFNVQSNGTVTAFAYYTDGTHTALYNDGSGYFADNNIFWSSVGAMTIKTLAVTNGIQELSNVGSNNFAAPVIVTNPASSVYVNFNNINTLPVQVIAAGLQSFNFSSAGFNYRTSLRNGGTPSTSGLGVFDNALPNAITITNFSLTAIPLSGTALGTGTNFMFIIYTNGFNVGSTYAALASIGSFTSNGSLVGTNFTGLNITIPKNVNYQLVISNGLGFNGVTMTWTAAYTNGP